MVAQMVLLRGNSMADHSGQHLVALMVELMAPKMAEQLVAMMVA